MGSVMMRVVSAARGGGAGAGAGRAGREAARNGGKRPADSMAGAGGCGSRDGEWGWGSAAPRARGPAGARRRCRPGNPAAFIGGCGDVTRRAPPTGGPAPPLKGPQHGERGRGFGILGARWCPSSRG